MKKILSKILKNIACLAVGILYLSANTTSGWVAHQPEIPEGINKYKI